MNKNTSAVPAPVLAAVLATGLLSFAGVIVETAMNITFPTLMREFDVSTSTVQWMTSIYLLVVAVIVPLSAIFKRSYPLKHLFLTANLAFILGILIDALAPNFWFLLVGRAIQGLGTGIALPLMFNIILEQVPKERVGVMMGLANMITGIAPAVGPTFGGVVVDSLGWHFVFYFLVPLLMLSLFLGLWGIRQVSQVQRAPIDWPSLLLIAVFFSGLMIGFSNLATKPFFSLEVAGSLVLGLLGMVGLSWRSLSIQKPILNLRLFQNGRFVGHVLGFFLTQIISLGFAFLLPNYIQLVNHNTALLAGMLVLPAGVAGAICGPLGGRMIDRVGARRPIMLGISACWVALLIFTLAARHLANPFIATVYVLYMAGMGTCMGSVMTSALRTLADNQQTEGNAILNTLQQFAGAVGTSLSAVVVAQSQAHLAGSQAYTTAVGTQNAFIMLTVFTTVIWFSYFKVVK